MPATAQVQMLKRQIEAQLDARIPAALSPMPQQAPRLLPCGIPNIDGLLGGGIPLGAITEFSGLPSSGRTSLAFAVLAGASADAACAYVDANDTADPRCLAAAGVRLENLLWVRLTCQCETATGGSVPASPVPEFDPRKLAGQRHGGHHPRTESRGVDVALGTMLKQKAETRSRKSEGTPGHPNRKLGLADASEEQIRYEQFFARQADESDPIRAADQRAAEEVRRRARPVARSSTAGSRPEPPWDRLDRAIRAADQILQAGGFRVVVLDLASTTPERVVRIPSATWFRFRRAAQESDAAFLLLTQAACARSSAACVLDCAAVAGIVDDNNILGGLSFAAEVARQRFGQSPGKKAPGRVAGWAAAPGWMRAAGR